MPWRPARQIAHEGSWAALGQIASVIGALASIRLLTEVLSPDEFGGFTLLVGLVALSLGLTAFPYLQAILRFYPEYVQRRELPSLRAVSSHKLRCSVLSAAGALTLGWIIASDRVGVGHWSAGILIAALLVVDAYRSFEVVMLNAARRQRAVALISAADALLRPLMALAAVTVFGASANAALLGYLLGGAITISLIPVTMRREGRPRVSEAPTDLNHDLSAAIRRYAWPLVPVALAGWLSGMGDRYLLGGLLGLKEAGLYAAAYGLASRPFLSMFAVIELTMRPVLQNAVAAKDPTEVARAKRVFLLLTLVGSTLGVLCFSLLSQWVAYLLLAADYRGAAYLMPWIALGYALNALSSVYTRFCYVLDGTKSVLGITVVGTLTGLIVMIPAIKLGGIMGAALAVAAQFAAELGVSYALAKRAGQKGC